MSEGACDYCDAHGPDDAGQMPLTYHDGGASLAAHPACYADMLSQGGCGDGDDDDSERARLAAIVGVP